MGMRRFTCRKVNGKGEGRRTPIRLRGNESTAVKEFARPASPRDAAHENRMPPAGIPVRPAPLHLDFESRTRQEFLQALNDRPGSSTFRRGPDYPVSLPSGDVAFNPAFLPQGDDFVFTAGPPDRDGTVPR